MNPLSDQTAGDAVQAIRVPRESVNADSVYVVGWLVPDGTFVEQGTDVCEVETSKAVFVVPSAHGGYLRHHAPVGAEVPVGGILGYVTAQAGTPLPTEPPQASRSIGGVARTSAKAKRLIDQFGLDERLFAGLGFVRERDVLNMIETRQSAGTREARQDPRGESRSEPLGPVQRRVARVMEESLAGIPVAYLDRRIDMRALRQRAEDAMTQSHILVTPVDLLVSAVASAAAQLPRFNSYLTADDRLEIFARVHVGVAVDVGDDLYVIVVKDAASKPVPVIAKELHHLQYLAQRRRLGVSELTGGTITVTSMLGLEIHGFRPIPYPQQAAIVGICDPEPGSTRAVLTLGFDHRIANGSQAAAFLAAIDAALQGT